MVDAHRQQGLGLHIDAALIEAGFDEYRFQLIVTVLAQGFVHLQADRLGLEFAQLQRRDHHGAGGLGLQGDDPASGGVVAAVKGGELVDLAGATHVEQRVQGRQVRLAELGDVVGLDCQLHRFPGIDAAAVDTGGQVGRLGVTGPQR